jgi:similar to stage IV sporulation protein
MGIYHPSNSSSKAVGGWRYKMLLLRLWNYLRGYVIIVVEGYFLEKFINICIHRQIYLWDIRKQKNCTMSLKISIKGFKMLRPIAKKTNCRIRLKMKRGLPFVLHRYKGRKAFVIGAILFVLLFYTMTSFIWTVEITGNKKIETGLILDKLAACGVKSGTLKYKVDTDRIVNDMMMDIKDLAWIGVSVKGTKVKIEVVERVKPPDLIKNNEPCDIVATRDGIIKSIITENGLDMVKSGDTVKKGQILIAGTVPNKREGEPPRIVHSIGSIRARTWYEKSCIVKTSIEEKQMTGETKSRFTVVMFNKKFGIFSNKIPYANYNKEEYMKKLSIGEDLIFPFSLEVEKYYEYKIIKKEISLDEAKKIASDTAYKEATKYINGDTEIVKTNYEFTQNENGQLMSTVVVECSEEIGKAIKIGGN